MEGMYADENQCSSDLSTWPNKEQTTGPNEEQAFADRHAVFYRNGTFTFTYPTGTRDREGCDWWSQVPQGFSCGRAVKRNQCFFEQFVPTPCSEVILKVATFRSCKKGDFANDCFDFPNYS